jgi:triosephosphate isomerase (TIM)
MRRIFIAGNWKMNKTPAEASLLANELKTELLDFEGVDVAVAPTTLALTTVAQRLQHTNICLCAQNLHQEASGAYTGEVSAEMLRSIGCEYVIIGHSERRKYFDEDDTQVNAKAKAALRAGLLPIICVGETLEQRQSGQYAHIVLNQVSIALNGIPVDQLPSITIAYEPVWAIGTGQTASPEQAQEVHAAIRGWLAQSYPAFVAKQLRIQYGGSVKPSNAATLLSQPDIDGALVGGASLTAKNFKGIISAAAAL